ncbi:MAG: Mth938-like domain-containing protein [Rhodospirillales bacterium]|nr:Mth938-like domain-containing protein [Rhodospirillales bacterium]
MDITPLVPAGRQLIQTYGDMRFRIAGVVHEGSVLVLPDRTLPWTVTDITGITYQSLNSLTIQDHAAEILLIGCGPRFVPEPAGLRKPLRDLGLVLEWMDTGAACRTFNVLLAEERPAAAALVAVE